MDVISQQKRNRHKDVNLIIPLEADLAEFLLLPRAADDVCEEP